LLWKPQEMNVITQKRVNWCYSGLSRPRFSLLQLWTFCLKPLHPLLLILFCVFSKPGTVHVLFNWTLFQPHGVGSIIIPILQMRKKVQWRLSNFLHDNSWDSHLSLPGFCVLRSYTVTVLSTSSTEWYSVSNSRKAGDDWTQEPLRRTYLLQKRF
jgi:hypothetical protein